MDLSNLKEAALNLVYQDIAKLGYVRPLAFFVKSGQYKLEYPNLTGKNTAEWLRCFGEGSITLGAEKVYFFLQGKFHNTDLPTPVPLDDQYQAVGVFTFDTTDFRTGIKCSMSIIQYKMPGKKVLVYEERFLEIENHEFFDWFMEGLQGALEKSGKDRL